MPKTMKWIATDEKVVDYPLSNMQTTDYGILACTAHYLLSRLVLLLHLRYLPLCTIRVITYFFIGISCWFRIFFWFIPVLASGIYDFLLIVFICYLVPSSVMLS